MQLKKQKGRRSTLMLALVVFVSQGDLVPSDAWVRLPAAGATTTTAFVNLKNVSMYDIYVVGASSDAAGRVEFRDARKQGDVAAQTVPNFAVPSSESVRMDVKGLHLVLSDLKQPLKEGAPVTLVLTTDGGPVVRIQTHVKEDEKRHQR